MWFLLPIAGLLGFAAFKSKGGVKGLGKEAGVAALDAAESEVIDRAKKVAKKATSLEKKVLNEGRKVYHFALSKGHSAETAMKSAKKYTKALFKKLGI